MIKSGSFLIIKDGKLLFERYWEPITSKTQTNFFSVTKSIVGSLVGIAIHDGVFKNLDEPAFHYFTPFDKLGFRKITIWHLLSMSSGLKWRELGGPLSHNAKAYYGENLLSQMAGLKQRSEPGIYFDYISCNTQILSFIIKKATGMTVSGYAEEKLWSLVRAENPAFWSLDSESGREKGFCCFYSTPRDLARLGQLYLNGGHWNDIDILSRGFVKEVVSRTSLKDKKLNCPNIRYGLHWWLGSFRDLPFYYARGIFGQYIICVPRLNTVIVRTGYRRRKVDKTGHPPDLFEYIDIVNALLKKESL